MRNRILRFSAALLLTLTVSVASAADESENKAPPGETALAATERFVSDCDDLDDALRQAMLTVLRQHPETTRWTGVSGERIFSVVTLEFPDSKQKNRVRQALRSECGIRVVAELLTAKSLLELYKSERLDDATTLKSAAMSVSSTLQSSGKLKLASTRIRAGDEYVMGVAVAPREEIAAILSESAQKELVKNAYRDVMHRQARQLMEKEQWGDALGFWRHLHERGLVSARLYLDAATCFVHLEKIADAAQVAREALETYADLPESAYYEALGDILLLDEKNEASQQAAEKAFELAAERFDGNRTEN